jgi:hypothetical protein
MMCRLPARIARRFQVEVLPLSSQFFSHVVDGILQRIAFFARIRSECLSTPKIGGGGSRPFKGSQIVMLH